MSKQQQQLENLTRVASSLGLKGETMTDEDVYSLMEVLPKIFTIVCKRDGYNPTAIKTKLRDAGRRSAPSAAFSKIIAGRPQNGNDGNRQSRWLLPSDDKQYATRRTASLVEIKYYLQVLSMDNAPEIESPDFQNAFHWLTSHRIAPGEYLDPIMVRKFDFAEFAKKPRLVHSGHLVPLARGGKHEPSNTFLMLGRSNTLQGDLTFEELLALIDNILSLQKSVYGVEPSAQNMPTEQFLDEVIA